MGLVDAITEALEFLIELSKRGGDADTESDTE
jgi:hypothetical protein